MTSSLRVRSYESADEAALVALWRVCGLVAPWNDPHKDIARKSRVNPEWLLVGEVGEGEPGIVASCMVGYEGHRGWINYLAVHPEHRRRGHGAALLAEAERMLRAAGCPKINLQVRSANREVIAFYERLGFRDDAVVSLGKRLVDDTG